MKHSVTRSFIPGAFACFLCVAFTGPRYPDTPDGRAIYQQKCARCHGADGTLGRWGAKNLQKTKLDDAGLRSTISEGRRFMPSWKKVFKEDELNAVIAFVKTLKKPIP